MTTLTLHTGFARSPTAAAWQPVHHPAPITLNRVLSLRAALFELLIFAGLLAGLCLASRITAAAGPAPVSLSASLDFYAGRGYPIQLCETGWAMGHSGGVTPQCASLTDPQQRFGHGELLREGDYLWIVLEGEAVRFDQLMARWGMPRLNRDSQGGLALVWDLPALHAEASLTWGEPHRTPQQAILTVKHA